MKKTILQKQLAMDDAILEDKAFRIGRLPNGLTYYIRHNEEPKKHCNIEILHRVGSLQEEEHERGLAHFLEHMAFNGTEHFPGYNGARKHLEALGVSTSATINACTSQYYTYYYLDHIPTDNPSVVDDCLQLVADWGGAFLLEGDCIDRERGVIKTEYLRGCSNSNRRLFNGVVDTATSGNLYAQRQPIGLLPVIEGFDHETIREFYRRWYIPQNQAMIVVGDVDVDEMEQKIESLFAGYHSLDECVPLREYPMVMNDKPIFAFASDKEQANTQIVLKFKFNNSLPHGCSILHYSLREAMLLILEIMIEMRIYDLGEMPGTPFLSINKDLDYFYGCTDVRSLDLRGTLRRGTEMDAYKTMLAFMLGIRAKGFSEQEFMQAKSIYLKRMERAFAERNHISNDTFCEMCFSHFLHNEPIMSLEGVCDFSKMIIDKVSLQDVNNIFADIVHADGRNMVSVVYAPDSDGEGLLPCAEDFEKMALEVLGSDISLSDCQDSDIVLLRDLPEPGKIVDEQYDERIDAYTLSLSNGARVTYKVTDFKDNEISFKLSARGGSSQFDVDDFPNFHIVTGAITSIGLADLSEREFSKFLADKTMSYEYGVHEYSHYLMGTTSRTDLEALMQLIYCFFCRPGHSEDDFRNFVNRKLNAINNYKHQPSKIMSLRKDALSLEDNSRNHWLDAEELGRADLKRILEIHRQLFSDAGAFDMAFVGSISVEEFKELAVRYLAALPCTNRGDMMRPEVVCDKRRPLLHCSQVDMVEPISKVSVMLDKWGHAFNIKNIFLTNMLEMYLNKRVGDEVRHKASISYSCGSSMDMGLDRKQPGLMNTSIWLSAEVQPQYGYFCKEILDNLLDTEMDNGISETDFRNVRTEFENGFRPSIRFNSFWLPCIHFWKNHGMDMVGDFDEVLYSISLEDFNAFMRDVICNSTRQTFVFTPTGVEQLSAPVDNISI